MTAAPTTALMRAATALLAAGALLVEPSATGAAGFGARAASPSSAATASAVFRPRLAARPTVGGEPVELDTLVGEVGAWERQPERFERQWLRCGADGEACAPIAGATGATYALEPADVGHRIRLRVTAVNAGGSAIALSAATPTVTESPLRTPPYAVAPPGIDGAATVGATLTATEGAWAGGPPTDTEVGWLRCDAAGEDCVPIRGATGWTYAVGEDDVGVRLRARVTKRNLGGDASARSAATGAVPLPDRTATIHGCRHPATGALVAGAGGWSPVTVGPAHRLAVENRCATDGYLHAAISASASQLINGDRAGWRFTAPPETRVHAVDLRRAARLRGLDVGERSHFHLVSSDHPGLPPEWRFLELGVWFNPLGIYPPGVIGPPLHLGTEDVPLAADNRVSASGLDAAWVEARVICGHNVVGAPCTGEASDYARMRLFSTAVAVEDTAPPGVASVGGPLAAEPSVGAVASVEVEASDLGLGLYRAKLLVDGVRAGGWQPLGTGSCADADPDDADPFDFLVPVPCPGSTTASLAFDIGDLPDGRHRVTLVLQDAGGNETVALDRDIHVRDER